MNEKQRPMNDSTDSIRLKENGSMKKYDIKVIFVSRTLDFLDAEKRVNDELEDGWEPWAITPSEEDAGDRVWLFRRC